MLINAWEPHAYVHDPRRPRTIILALYIEPSWLKDLPAELGGERCAGLFRSAVRRGVAAHPPARADDLAAEMVARRMPRADT